MYISTGVLLIAIVIVYQIILLIAQHLKEKQMGQRSQDNIDKFEARHGKPPSDPGALKVYQDAMERENL